MSADLPPDVRDRAAQRIKSIFWNASYRQEDDQYLAMVDAVAEVLAGDQVFPFVTPEQHHARYLELLGPVVCERDALKARVDLLTAALSELVDAAEEAIPFVGFEGYLPERTEQLRYRVNAARAALSAGPTNYATKGEEGAFPWAVGQTVLYHPTDPCSAAKSATVLAVDNERGVRIRLPETGIETWVGSWHLTEYPNAQAPTEDKA